jgi:DNA-binding protein YbaB
MKIDNCKVEITSSIGEIKIKPDGADEWIRITISATGIEDSEKLRQVVANAEASELGHDSFAANVEIEIHPPRPK